MASIKDIFVAIGVLTTLPSHKATEANIRAFLSVIPADFIPLEEKHPYIAHRVEIALGKLDDNAIVTPLEKNALRTRMKYLLTGK